MDASRPWQYASSGVPASPGTSALTAKMMPDATGQLYAPLRETTISGKMPAGTQLGKQAKCIMDLAIHTSTCFYTVELPERCLAAAAHLVLARWRIDSQHAS